MIQLSKLNMVVVSVAVGQRPRAGPPAKTDERVDLVLGLEGDGLKGGAQVGGVAEGLRVGESARAVQVLFPCLQLHPS